MLLVLLAGVLLGAPDVLVVLRPPEAPGILREAVWPALGAGRIGRWTLRPVALDRLERSAPDAAGGIWADQGPDGRVRLHRILFEAGTHLVDPIDLPPGAAGAAVTEAVRLRLRFLLDAPVSLGDPWREAPESPSTPPPEPPPFDLPAQHLVDLTLVRAPPVPPRKVQIPAPPPPLSEAVPEREPAGPAAIPISAWIGLGVDGLVDLDGADGGLLARIAVPIGHGHLAVHGALHPFHDFQRAGRPLGVTGYRAVLAWGWPAWLGGGAQLDLRVGAGVRALIASGAGARGSGATPILTAEAPLRLGLRPPFALSLEGGLQFALGEAQARYGDEALVTRSAVQARLGLLLEWGVP